MYAKQQSYMTSKISTFLHDIPLGAGSGFIYKFGQSHYLVTNWHILSGRHPIAMHNLHSRDLSPNRIEFHVTLRWPSERQPDGSFRQKLFFKPIDLGLTRDGEPIWYEGAGHNYIDDIAIIPLDALIPELKTGGAELVAINGGQVAIIGEPTAPSGVVNILPEIAEDVFILGYPRSQTFQNILPVWKRGTIASEPLISVVIDGQTIPDIIFLDAATNSGMSGAPVLYFGTKLRTINGDELISPRFDDPILVGVYAGRDGVTPLENSMGLGRVWKTQRLDALLFTENHAPGGTFHANFLRQSNS